MVTRPEKNVNLVIQYEEYVDKRRSKKPTERDLLPGAHIMEGMMDKLNHSLLILALPAQTVSEGVKDGTLRVRSYPKGAIVHFEGETCDRLEIILAGQAIVERIDVHGGLMRIAQLGPDALLGGNLLFAPHPHYPMTISAQSNLVVLEIRTNTLFALLSQHPAFLKVYLETVSVHTYLLGNKIRHDLHRSIRESLRGWLRQEAFRQQSHCLRMPMSKKELAEKIGVQRTSLSRELAKMKRDRLIDFTAETVTILDPAFLSEDSFKERRAPVRQRESIS